MRNIDGVIQSQPRRYLYGLLQMTKDLAGGVQAIFVDPVALHVPSIASRGPICHHQITPDFVPLAGGSFVVACNDAREPRVKGYGTLRS
jgi:hypothetical protein